MFTIIKKLLLMIMAIAVLSCNVRDVYDDCGIYLHFIFDYNMEFADSFGAQVETVDVYIFDENGIYLFHKHANCSNDLIGRNQMWLSDEIPFGTYKLITVGGLSDHFHFTDLENNDFVIGSTTIEQIKLALDHQTNEVSHEFPHVWFGETKEIHYQADQSVWPIHLIRNTNNFHVVFHNTDAASKAVETVPFTFSIITPEGAAYDYNNSPLIREKTIYHPFSLEQDDEVENLSVGKLNTMRLFANDPDSYRLVIRNADTMDVVWDYDLMDLLRNTKPSHPDGTSLPLQEYLDRQADWNIVILYRGTPESDENLVALKIFINGWIIWENDIEL